MGERITEILIILLTLSKKKSMFSSARTAFRKDRTLQDCDCVVNYDIHWNPVRIIQRFGRVDRIGTKNASVKLVNFWPDIDLNEYIDLTDRVKNRMQAVNIAGIVLQALRGGGRRHDDITGRIAARAGGAALPP